MSDRLSASDARAQGRTQSQKQIRKERGFTEAERQAARAWFASQSTTEGDQPGSKSATENRPRTVEKNRKSPMAAP